MPRERNPISKATESADAMRGSRVASLTALAMLLAGCAILPSTTVDTFRLVTAGKPKLELSAAAVAARPYYQLLVDSSEGSAVLVLGNVDAGREAWYSAGKEILFLHHGVLVKTYGLQSNIDATQLPEDSPFRTGLQHLQAPVETSRVLDLSPGYRYGVNASSRLTPAGVEAVEILGTSRRLLRIDEQLQVPALELRTDNRYWVDPADGFVWKSRQTIPGSATLTLTALRPYRGEQR